MTSDNSLHPFHSVGSHYHKFCAQLNGSIPYVFKNISNSYYTLGRNPMLFSDITGNFFNF